ncbi:hypothetical protein PT286_08715 [Neisseriaceae bacterium ESL0693]|nr:hypothetical protein [Neisseriaceae bacterium ESL0693]
MFGTMLQATANGTKAMLTFFSLPIQKLFSELLSVPVITGFAFLSILRFAYNESVDYALDKVASMIVDEIVKYRSSKICYQTVRLKWRSPMQIVLLWI